LKLGGSPESVFWAANITMFISELVSVFVLKRYIRYSIRNYLLNVHGRCIVVSLIAAVVLYYFTGMMDEGFGRLFITILISVILVTALGFTIGIDKEIRNRIYALMKK
jgi:predicted membrane protein